ncbi:ADP-ribosylation factor-like protein 3 isoform X1 [Drosophila pseudoobscura]|uniref:ADP-ribosylation factor-like protein 3 isoform X1 n=1 Tax=Drosophila pseudoobscura pseudoobscura TaxID=46245 RepID=A0A6I8VPL7_DROPS|nr:ADP-ribosylation factor-like protein 3 isoform X1 [Drosophila pseudoobscura]
MCFSGSVSLIRKLLPPRAGEPCLLVLGLDNAGKSSLTGSLADKLGDGNVTASMEVTEVRLKIKNTKIKMFDLNGRLKNRQLWANYYKNVRGLIFVIDSKDAARLSEARCVLCDVLLDERLRNVPLLIVANKQDALGAMSGRLMVDLMGLSRLEGREWIILECSVTTGSGIQTFYRASSVGFPRIYESDRINHSFIEL